MRGEKKGEPIISPRLLLLLHINLPPFFKIF